MEYKQKTKDFDVKGQTMSIEYTFKSSDGLNWETDSILITYKGKTMQAPNHWVKLSESTILEKALHVFSQQAPTMSEMKISIDDIIKAKGN